MSFIVRHGQLLKLFVVAFAALTVLALFLYIVEAESRFDKASQTLSNSLRQASTQVEHLSRLQSVFGYNGFIHNFKNYVLRRDQTYKLAAQENYADIVKLIALIENDNALSENQGAINDIKSTAWKYFNYLDVISPVLIPSGIPLEDAVVKVDDTAASKAFDHLFSVLHARMQNSIETANRQAADAHRFIRFGYGLIALVIGITAVILVLIRRIEIKTVEAMASSQAKSSFLSAMSHEIRTPLNGVLGLVQLLNLKKFSAEEKYHLNLIQSSGELLLGILNDILDISKIEAREIQIESLPTDLNNLLSSTTDFYKNIASEQGIIVTYDSNLNDFGNVNTDPTKLRQVLSNILSNAVKFTSEGQISVLANAKKVPHDDTEICQLILTIKDTGIGMDKKALDNLFNKFSQADASISRKYGGTGLGMAIANELVTLMGGRIEASSHLGRGTTFKVFLNLDFSTDDEIINRTAGEADYKRVLGGLNVIVAEDNVVNSVVAKGFLENLGMRVRIAHTGLEALQEFRTQKPDLILMDINMPDMDGLKATREIRAIEEGDRVPILALTADAFSHTRDECSQSGMNDIITKPFSFDGLRNKIYDCLK